jgi:2-oxoglutarate dehydrogenase E1 component
MTPKSLLRHPDATSTFEDLAHGKFLEVLGDTSIEQSHAPEVDRVIVSSGKVYFDLVEYRRAHGLQNVALIRLEQLYPFPAEQLAAEMARYPNVKKVVWAQEEARNQGAWKVLEEDLRSVVPNGAQLRDSSREASPSTAPGYPSLHVEQQAYLVKQAFAV